jgi:hypothetical protein
MSLIFCTQQHMLHLSSQTKIWLKTIYTLVYTKDKIQPSHTPLIHIQRFNNLSDLNFLLQVMYAKNEFLSKA